MSFKLDKVLDRTAKPVIEGTEGSFELPAGVREIMNNHDICFEVMHVPTGHVVVILPVCKGNKKVAGISDSQSISTIRQKLALKNSPWLKVH